MTTGIKTLISAFTDVFTLGRMIFYPVVGAVLVVPLDLLIRSALHEPAFVKDMPWRAYLLMDLRGLGSGGAAELAALYFGSTIVGFLIATLGFSLCLGKWTQIDGVHYASLHPHLKQGDEDYSLWLDAEYFRYAELSVFLPLSLILGSVVTGIYFHGIGVPTPWAVPVATALASLLWLIALAHRTAASYKNALLALIHELEISVPPKEQEPPCPLLDLAKQRLQSVGQPEEKA